MNYRDYEDDDLGYAGGREMPEEYAFIPPPDTKRFGQPQSEIDIKIIRLLVLNPDLPIKFRNYNLKRLDEPSKVQFLADLRKALGIEPL